MDELGWENGAITGGEWEEMCLKWPFPPLYPMPQENVTQILASRSLL